MMVPALACTVPPGERGATGAALDAPASRCEVFVDAAAVITGDSGLLGTRVYIKTRNRDLDGPIAEVGFYGRRTAHLADGGTAVDPWAAFAAQPFPNASDYWSVDFFTSNDAIPSSSYEGAFYVRTTSGQALWANAVAAPGSWETAAPPHATQNFVVDGSLTDLVARTTRSEGAPGQPGDRLSSLQITSSDAAPYLNPASCR
jgi:hypothetical protein